MSWYDGIVTLFFPNRCLACNSVIEAGVFCARCENEIFRHNPPVCPYCGRSQNPCGCRGSQYDFKRCISPFVYAGSIRRAVIQFKFYGKRGYANLLAGHMYKTLKREYGNISFDMIMPVPMYARQKRRRSYNQSGLLAKSIHKYTHIPFFDKVLVKHKETMQQHKLKKEDRKHNVAGAFSVKNSHTVQGKIILLVDDIITTGWTLHQCATVLKAAGAKEVYAVTCATSD